MPSIQPFDPGRHPSPIDPRDYRAVNFIPPVNPLRQLLEFLLAMIRRPKRYPTKIWLLNSKDLLDQGKTPHCGGFGSLIGMNVLGSEKVSLHYTDAEAHRLYYDIKEYENEPKQENGIAARDAMKVMQRRGYFANYAACNSIDEILKFLTNPKGGPVWIGSIVFRGFFNPDSSGFVKFDGPIDGGHWYCLRGYDAAKDAFLNPQSWGPTFGLRGECWIPVREFRKAWVIDGECYAAVEVPNHLRALGEENIEKWATRGKKRNDQAA